MLPCSMYTFMFIFSQTLQVQTASPISKTPKCRRQLPSADDNVCRRQSPISKTQLCRRQSPNHLRILICRLLGPRSGLLGRLNGPRSGISGGRGRPRRWRGLGSCRGRGSFGWCRGDGSRCRVSTGVPQRRQPMSEQTCWWRQGRLLRPVPGRRQPHGLLVPGRHQPGMHARSEVSSHAVAWPGQCVCDGIHIRVGDPPL